MSRRVRVRGARAVIVVAGLTVGLVGGVGTGAVAFAASTPASGSQASPNLNEADPAKVAEYMAAGFNEGEALFLALTKIETAAVGHRGVRITESFPTGNQAVINVSVVPATVAEPGAPKIQSHSSGGDFIFSLDYFVSSDAIPADARKAIGVAWVNRTAATAVLAAYSPASAASGLPASAAANNKANGVQVVVKGVVKKFATDQATAFAKLVDALEPGDSAPATGLLASVKAGLGVVDAFALKNELDARVAELDALEQCAKNPTDPLTKKTYASNPSEQNRVLKEIAATRAELKGNSAVAFVATLNKEAAGTIKAAPWLLYIVGPGTAWALDNFRQVAQDRMNELRKGVVPCAVDLKIDNSGVTSVKCGGPVGAWVVDFEARLGGEAVVGSATATFTLAAGTLSGPYEFNGSAQTGIGIGTFGETGTVTYTASADGASGTLAFSERGSYPVTIGTFCANGVPTGG